MTVQPRGLKPNLALALSGLSVVGAVGYLWINKAQLPSPLATHWGLSGKPNGAMSLNGCMAFLAVFGLFPVAMRVFIKPSNVSRITFGAMSLMLGGMTLALAWLTVDLNASVSSWRQARALGWEHYLAIVAPPLAGLSYLWLRRQHLRPPDVEGHAAVMLLQAQQRAMWTAKASNPLLLIIILPSQLLLGAILLQPQYRSALWIHGAVTVALVMVLEAFSSVRVRIDHRGVHLSYGYLGLWKQHIELSAIARADAFELDPMAHGGWGYRGSLRLMKRAAIVVRAGDAIRLTLNNGRTLSVTVDDAETGASLLNALLQQSSATTNNAPTPPFAPTC